MEKRYITASELAEYVYCQCCWMDTLEGKREVTFEMKDGTTSHEKIHSTHLITKYLQKIALLIIAGSIIGIILIGYFKLVVGIPLW